MTTTTEETTTSVGPWWHAYGMVREDWGGVWQLTVISPSTVPPEIAADLGADAWGPYLTSWDHEPTDAEKNEVTPEEYRDELDADRDLVDPL